MQTNVNIIKPNPSGSKKHKQRVNKMIWISVIKIPFKSKIDTK